MHPFPRLLFLSLAADLALFGCFLLRFHAALGSEVAVPLGAAVVSKVLLACVYARVAHAGDNATRLGARRAIMLALPLLLAFALLLDPVGGSVVAVNAYLVQSVLAGLELRKRGAGASR